MTNQATVDQFLNTHKTFSSFDEFNADLEKQIEFQAWRAQTFGSAAWHYGISKLMINTKEEIEKLQCYLDTFKIQDSYLTKTNDLVDIRLEILNVHKSENHFVYENGKFINKAQTAATAGFQIRFWLNTNGKACEVYNSLKLHYWKQHMETLKTVFEMPKEEFYKVVSGKETTWKGHNEPI